MNYGKANMACGTQSCVFILLLVVAGLGQSLPSKQAEVDGVYQFVSEKTTLLSPQKKVSVRAAPQWGGMWHLRNGFFSTILLRLRSTPFDQSENQGDDFSSFAGIYSVKKNVISFSVVYASGPIMQEKEIRVRFQRVGERLIFTQTLRPHLHESLEGTVVTTLRKLRPGEILERNIFTPPERMNPL